MANEHKHLHAAEHTSGSVDDAHEAAHIQHDTTWAALGDLIVGTNNDTASILSRGTDTQYLVADSVQATGLSWVEKEWDAVIITTGQSSTANTTATNVPNLVTANLAANGTYRFRSIILANKSSLTAGLKFAVAIPSGTISAKVEGHSTGTTWVAPVTINASATLAASIFATAANVDSTVMIEGFVVNGATTTSGIQIQIAAVTSQNARTQAGSVLMVKKVA